MQETKKTLIIRVKNIQEKGKDVFKEGEAKKLY